MPGYELHVISTGKSELSRLAAIAADISPYVTAIHLREKHRERKELLIGVQLLLEAGVPAASIVVNGQPAVALAALAGGLHMPGSALPLAALKEQCPPQMRLGVSVHSLEEARQREREGADYVMYGHIYSTNSKPGLPPRGLDSLRQLTQGVRIPVIAVGGITAAAVKPVIEAGAAGVAVMSGILDAPDPLHSARVFAEVLRLLEVGA